MVIPIPTGSITSCAFLLLLAVGMSSAKYLSSYGNEENFQPIVTSSQAKRICAALCMSGLGGKSCGDECLDITPDGLPGQSVNKSRESHAVGASKTSRARSDVCPVLCINKLGYPLCNCEGTQIVNEEVDFIQICGNLCIEFNYRVYGCQSCNVYKAAVHMYTNLFSVTPAHERSSKGVDWEEWCKQMCIIGEGGVACNCDILPMALNID